MTRQVYRKSKILDPYGKNYRMPLRERVDLQASYDVIQRQNDTDHWKYATSHSSSALDTQELRQRLRNLARYEFRNNPYCKGMVLKLAHEILGPKGPQLEIRPKKRTKVSTAAASKFERHWKEHADEMDLFGKLKTGLIERPVGGEVFNVFRSNPRLSVPVDFEVYEGDQFQTPYYLWQDILKNREYPPVDGMVFDSWGNVTEYHRLKYHPSGLYPAAISLGEVDYVDPAVCCHLYRKERPSQYRGVSELAPCLELFARLRRYREATVETAERQASIAGTMETNLDPELCADIGSEPIEIEMAGGIFVNTPDGWRVNPFNSSQPVQGYDEFVSALLHEIISTFLLPWNVATGDSSDYNFASGRLDYLIFYRFVDAMRDELERKLLSRFFKFWLEFAMLIPGVIPSGLGAFDFYWNWGVREPIDPVKAAQAAKTKKESGLLDEEKHWRDHGRDARDVIESNIRLKLEAELREKELREEMGLEPAQPQPTESNESEQTEQQETQANENEAVTA